VEQVRQVLLLTQTIHRRLQGLELQKVQAEKVAAIESLSTVKSSEAALSNKPIRKSDNQSKRPGDARRPDVRDRDDIDKVHESPDRYFRRLEEVENKLGALRAEKRRLLQAILAFRQGLPNPDKKLLTAKDEELASAVNPKEKKSEPAESKPVLDGGSTKSKKGVRGADKGD